MTDSPSRAAVLVPLCGSGTAVEVVLTQRAHTLRRHRGQIAFPGGKYEPEHDESLLATALREAAEEIGLNPRDVEVIGALPEVYTRSSQFVISPFVGRLPEAYPFEPDGSEVAEIFVMPLAAYRDPARRITHIWPQADAALEVPAIDYEGRIVWGATLRILDLLVKSPLLDRLG